MVPNPPAELPFLHSLRELMHGDDGSLPDIFIDFGGEALAAEAYALIQSCAVPATGILGHIWCQARGRDFDIHHGENPAALLLTGDADPFHVSYDALHAPNGAALPGLGVYLDAPELISVNYRRGADWTDTAIMGLFSLVEKVASLAASWQIKHKGNCDDPDGSRLLLAFRQWQELGRPAA
ncbi:hypothetical protein [Tahibacter harae]|uniref:Uncharacterized protein n=1 Tax=Tahibacter harae TaxID=2963937 RepID=A0ABT1QSL7_9GAMM|nr:hypothetical protein [Tahibacter harae]MCQ4165264.1 hypothetical protein [Tahibacter harae]